ncbi:MAG: hypothetical protein JWM21_2940 [Acidobacteria bacterium]|nr:hypothetical protein [Acidobacteriota bacterium]
MKNLALLFLLIVGALICPRIVVADDQRAQEILKQARAAIGGEEILQTIQGLVLKGQYRRIMGDRELSGDRDLSILLPDKYLIEDSLSEGSLSTAIINTKGLNGQRAWNGSSGGGGGHMIIRMAGPGGQQQATPEQMEAMFRRQYGMELTRYLLAILLTPPSSLGVEYVYAGESDVEDAHAEAIDVRGPDNFAVRLFFDKQTHMPLLLSYRGRKQRIMTSFARSTGANSEDAIKKAREEADKKLAAEGAAKPEDVDFFIRLTDYKRVNGLLLPHKLTFLTETEVSEEFAVSKYQLNPHFKSDKFQKQ